MALVKCKECGKQVSSKASACPACGSKVPKKTSPVTWLAVAAFSFLVYVSMSADDDGPSAASTGNSSTSSANGSAPTTPAKKEPPATPAWRTITSVNEMTGDKSAYAISPSTGSTREMKFPYSGTRAALSIGCDSSSEWAYVKFSQAPNLMNTETKDGYNLVDARMKWDESIVRERFTQDWSSEFVHFVNGAKAIEKMAASTSAMLEVNWHSNGDTRFDFSLNGSAAALSNIRSMCANY